ncbi:MAG: citrate synthase [Bifidobacteriaceae bacterium]|jgi:citrate synthase|nr:citrate synthase [Bifidobacteriaceae bacterium]
MTTPIRLAVGNRELDLARVEATAGNDGVGISALLASTGLMTVDPGFMNTASCASDITFIDGAEGILRYRGYPIEQLAEHSTYLETAYLLIHGRLPAQSELDAFLDRVGRHMYLPEDFREILSVQPRSSHPMAVLGAAIQTMACFYPESMDPLNEAAVELATGLLLAKMPTIISYIHRRAAGYALLYPVRGEGYIRNFARMTFAHPGEEPDIPDALVRALDTLLILHADHEQNCSTSTVRMVGSAHANLYSSISAGVAALSGPLHGGANEAVLSMLAKIRDSGRDVKSFMEKVKNKEEGVKLMGFGHRVYKNYDPRAAIVRKSADEVLAALGVNDELLDIAREVEAIALQDDYFISRKLYPNVDFYTGIIYRAMGFPSSMFTPLFAFGRLPGWIAQWCEMMHDPTTRIGRPRQIYVGPVERDYVPIEDRA